MKITSIPSLITLLAILTNLACKKSKSTDTEATVTNPVVVTTVGAGVPDIYKKLYGASSITSDGTYLTIKSNGLPDHKSAYYATNNSLYENFVGVTFGGSNFAKNPNSMTSQNYTFKIPLNPAINAAHASTPMGPIGVAINGVPLYNQYAGGGAALSGEIVSFDQGYGHPDPGSRYHYHVEPIKLTATKGTDALMGFLLDGFPVYGPKENGSTVATASLDVYHGHFSITADYPAGIYHYHFSTDAPYLNGNGFYGTAGTVSF
jgi:hypothetical protein